MEEIKTLPDETMYENQVLVDMSLHPTPLEEVDPLACDMIKEENIKKELNLDNEYISSDDYQETSALGLRYKVKSEVKVKDELEHYETKEEISETVTVRDCDLYICNICGCAYKNKSDIVNNLTTKDYRCDVCNVTYNNSHKSEILLNFKTIHNKKRENYRTDKTDLIGEFSPVHRNDIYSITGVCKFGITSVKQACNDNILQCDVCKETFLNVGSLIIHKSSCSRLFRCSFCLKSFSRLGHLKQHERTHTGSKPYKCSFCEKTFSQSGHLTTHERIHTGSKPFKCKCCEKSFTQSAHLRTHEKIHRDCEHL